MSPATEKDSKPAPAPAKQYTVIDGRKIEVRGGERSAALTKDQKEAKRIPVDADQAKREAEFRERQRRLFAIANHIDLPFSKLTFADGSEALIDRLKRPVWRFRPGTGVSRADPNEQLPQAARREWIFNNDNPPYENTQGVEEP